ncbi:MAG: WecB/TagA/CpsF family glycosyltransferase [Verrucomicrobiia bacterium]|jgi:N-acetylglucosaminyldiphosphoundecaprenol N-acetyl-beta-D-mannosaminyltransferase
MRANDNTSPLQSREDSALPPRINALGVGISALNLQSALNAVSYALTNKIKGYICVTGVHGVSVAQEDAEFKKILNKSLLCTPDGMPLVWLGRYYYKRKEMDRVYGPDLMKLICQWSKTNGRSHFLYGGLPGVANSLKQRLETEYPGINIVGCYTPPFRPLNASEEQELIELVRNAKPDIIWVGLSTPKQERFMAQYIQKLDTTLMIGVGAAFDFLTGRVRQAPLWMRRAGLEWFFRMCIEPKRLIPRYLKNNPVFLFKIALQISGIKKYEIED